MDTASNGTGAAFGYMSRRNWLALAGWVLGFTLVASILVGVYTSLTSAHLGPEAQVQGLLDALILPPLIAIPTLTFLGLKLYQIADMNDRLKRLASTDMLTGCLNRRAFMDAFDSRDADGAGAFLVIDADHFKQVNDRFGHLGGDAALQAVAAAIRSAVREGDLVARFGGEEFGVYLPGADQAVAGMIAERIVATVNGTPFTANGRHGALAVSVGGAVFGDRVPFEQAYRQADRRLYEAKDAGRNRAIVLPLAA